MEIVLHIGAHRTGSTALEHWLSARSAALAASGIAIWPPRDLRAITGFRRAPALVRARGGRALRTLAFARGALAEMLEDSAAKTHVLSEENILGEMMRNLTDGVLYPDAGARLAAYAAFLPVPPRRIGLGLRSYADYWLSSYGYALRHRDLPDFGSLAERLADSARGWNMVVADIAAAVPEAELVVWPVETLGHDPAPAGKALLGEAGAAVATHAPPEGHRVAPEPGERVNAGPRIGHIPRIAALRSADPAITAPEIDRRLDGARPARFDGFSPAQRQAMDARYAADLAHLRKLGGRVRVVDGIKPCCAGREG